MPEWDDRPSLPTMKIPRLRTQIVILPIGPPILTALLGSIHTTGCVLTFLNFFCEHGQIFRLTRFHMPDSDIVN